MSFLSIIFAITVGVINTKLNTCVQDAAQNSGGNSFWETIFSVKFLMAFGVGTLSIIVLMAFYYHSEKLNLAQSLILMGSMSIIIGTFYGWYFRGNHITPIEILVLLTIIGSYSYKYLNAN